MTDEEVIRALEEHRQQRAVQEMQGIMAQAMFGAGPFEAPAPAPMPARPSMLELLQQVEQAEQRASMDFQDVSDEEAQTVLKLLLDL